MDLSRMSDAPEVASMRNDAASLTYEQLKTVAAIVQDETEGFGVPLFVACKHLPETDLWNQEGSFKAYLVYYSLFAFHTLENGGNLVLKVRGPPQNIYRADLRHVEQVHALFY